MSIVQTLTRRTLAATLAATVLLGAAPVVSSAHAGTKDDTKVKLHKKSGGDGRKN